MPRRLPPPKANPRREWVDDLVDREDGEEGTLCADGFDAASFALATRTALVGSLRDDPVRAGPAKVAPMHPSIVFSQWRQVYDEALRTGGGLRSEPTSRLPVS